MTPITHIESVLGKDFIMVSMSRKNNHNEEKLKYGDPILLSPMFKDEFIAISIFSYVANITRLIIMVIIAC